MAKKFDVSNTNVKTGKAKTSAKPAMSKSAVKPVAPAVKAAAKQSTSSKTAANVREAITSTNKRAAKAGI